MVQGAGGFPASPGRDRTPNSPRLLSQPLGREARLQHLLLVLGPLSAAEAPRPPDSTIQGTVSARLQLRRKRHLFFPSCSSWVWASHVFRPRELCFFSSAERGTPTLGMTCGPAHPSQPGLRGCFTEPTPKTEVGPGPSPRTVPTPTSGLSLETDLRLGAEFQPLKLGRGCWAGRGLEPTAGEDTSLVPRHHDLCLS